MKKLILIFAMTLAGSAGLGFAEAKASANALRSFFADVQSLEADFAQRVEDENGSILESSGGKFYLSRPGKFYWDYQAVSFDNAESGSEQGQQIVADGESLYFYDPDLEQVSKRSLANALGQVPSLLLVQNGADIDEHFSITDFGLTDGLSWVALKPKDEDAGYQQLMIGFDNNTISSLLLYDGLGNSTRLDLSAVKVNAELDASLFEFVVPEGADLLSE